MCGGHLQSTTTWICTDKCIRRKSQRPPIYLDTGADILTRMFQCRPIVCICHPPHWGSPQTSSFLCCSLQLWAWWTQFWWGTAGCSLLASASLAETAVDGCCLQSPQHLSGHTCLQQSGKSVSFCLILRDLNITTSDINK